MFSSATYTIPSLSTNTPLGYASWLLAEPSLLSPAMVLILVAALLVKSVLYFAAPALVKLITVSSETGVFMDAVTVKVSPSAILVFDATNVTVSSISLMVMSNVSLNTALPSLVSTLIS